MKKIVQLASFLALVFVFANIDTNAQAFGKRFDANVSFDFAIGDEILPAGKYFLRLAGDPNGPAVLEVRDAKREIVYQGLVLTNVERLNNKAGLRFENSSGFPALASIVSDGAGYSVPVASRARLLAANGGAFVLKN